MNIEVTINGEARSPQASDIAALVSELEITAMRIAVAKNGQVIPKAEHEKTPIESGDRIEIVRMVGGG